MPSRDATRYSGTEQTEWTPESRNLQAITTYIQKLEERDPELANELKTVHLTSTDMAQVSWLQKENGSPEKLLHAFRDSSNHLDEAQMDHLAERLVHTLTIPAWEKVQELEGIHDHAARMGTEFNPENFNALMEKSAQALNKRLETAEEYLKEGLREGLLEESDRETQLNDYLKNRYGGVLTELVERAEDRNQIADSLPEGSPEIRTMSNAHERDALDYENTLGLMSTIFEAGAFEAGISEAREAQERAAVVMTEGKMAFCTDPQLNQEISALHNERKESLFLAHTNALWDKLPDEAREFQAENPSSMIEMFDQPGYVDSFKEFAATLIKEDQAWLANTITWRVNTEEMRVPSGTGHGFPESARVSSALKQAMDEIR